MELLLALLFTWFIACAVSTWYLRRESVRLQDKAMSAEYYVAVRYLAWVEGRLAATRKMLPDFLKSPFLLTFYLPGKDQAVEQVKAHAEKTVERARDEIRLRYAGGKPWIHPADQQVYRIKYAEWFQETQAKSIRSVRSKLRFRMGYSAVSEMKKSQPCECAQPRREMTRPGKDVCSCGGLLPKDPASFILP